MTERVFSKRDLTSNQASLNPCLKEAKLSEKCLIDNNYDKDSCQKHFLNYRNCKYFWASVQNDRRRRGIKPLLPTAEERDKVKEEYINRMRQN